MVRLVDGSPTNRSTSGCSRRSAAGQGQHSGRSWWFHTAPISPPGASFMADLQDRAKASIVVVRRQSALQGSGLYWQSKLAPREHSSSDTLLNLPQYGRCRRPVARDAGSTCLDPRPIPFCRLRVDRGRGSDVMSFRRWLEIIAGMLALGAAVFWLLSASPWEPLLGCYSIGPSFLKLIRSTRRCCSQRG
jgi:hypothetical protein